MKAWKALAVMLVALALTGCVSKEKPPEPAAATDQDTIVAHLLDAHHETVGQMRVSTALRPQNKVECN